MKSYAGVTANDDEDSKSEQGANSPAVIPDELQLNKNDWRKRTPRPEFPVVDIDR